MMHVLFVEPAFPDNQREFVRALHKIGVRVTGIGERPVEFLDDALKGWLHHYEQVGSVVDDTALLAAVQRCQAREWVDRLEATVEAHILPAARVREARGIPGTSVRTAFLCRDKPAMKQALREAHVPCARSSGVKSIAEARAFAEQIGYPLILKPRAAAGAAGTHKIEDAGQLQHALIDAGVDRGASAALEEFVEGHEGFFDTLCVDGRPIHEFITHYYPNVLEAMRERWISPRFVTTNRLDAPAYDELRRLSMTVIEALGIGTSPTHMEWFFGPKGLRFSEIGCRPPGVRAWDVYCAANEMDLYEEWARTIAGIGPAQRPSRRYSAGMIALRPTGDGRISGYEGVDRLHHEYGQWIIDSYFPQPGTPTQPVDAGFMANAWLRMRHPDYDELNRMFDDIGQMVKVHAA